MAIIIHVRGYEDKEEYFFSTDHCQPDVHEDFVPITFSHLIKKEVRELYMEGANEIPNPNPYYQA